MGRVRSTIAGGPLRAPMQLLLRPAEPIFRSDQVLSGLIIENFKTFGGVHPIPLAPLTVIYGANSSGKSSILQALLFLKQNVHLNDDPSSPVLLDGPIVDLGGFRQLVHLHQIGNQVTVTPLFRSKPVNTGEIQIDGSTPLNGSDLIGLGYSISLDINNVPRVSCWNRYTDLVTEPSEVLALNALQPRGTQSEPTALRKVLARNAIRGILGLPTDEKLLFVLQHIQHLLFYLQEILIRPANLQDIQRSTLEYINTFIHRIDTLSDQYYTLQVSQKQLDALGHVSERLLLSKCRSLFSVHNGKTILDEFSQSATENIISIVDLITNMSDTEFSKYRRNKVRSPDVGGTGGTVQSARRDSFGLHAGSTDNPTDEMLPRVSDIKSYMSRIAHVGPARQVQGRFGQYALEPTENVGTIGENLLTVLVSSPDIVEQVNFWLSILNIRYRLAVQIHDKNSRLASIVVQDLVSNSTSSLSDVGFGVGQIIPILAELCSSRDGALLIEQPELHLHPSAQGLLARLLIEASRRRQVIIETHSEHLVLAIQRCVQDQDLSSSDVSVLCVTKQKSGSRVQQMELTEDGNFAEPWLDEFFPDRLSLRYGESS